MFIQAIYIMATNGSAGSYGSNLLGQSMACSSRCKHHWSVTALRPWLVLISSRSSSMPLSQIPTFSPSSRHCYLSFRSLTPPPVLLLPSPVATASKGDVSFIFYWCMCTRDRVQTKSKVILWSNYLRIAVYMMERCTILHLALALTAATLTPHV